MVEISKISFIKLQKVSNNILNRYSTLTSSFCMIFSVNDLWQEHFPSETVIHKKYYFVEFYYQNSFCLSLQIHNLARSLILYVSNLFSYFISKK